MYKTLLLLILAFTGVHAQITPIEDNTLVYNFIHNNYFQISLLLLIVIIIIFVSFEYRTRKILKKKTHELNLKNEIFNKNICSVNVSKEGIITSVSLAYCKLSGYSSSELIGQNHQKIRDKETPKELYQDLWLSITSGHSWNGEIKNIKKNGDPFWIELIISPSFDKHNNILSYDGIIHDISAQKMLHDFNEKLQEEVTRKTVELKELATTDKLTGINNRVAIDSTLEKSYLYFTEHQENFSVIIIDIDYFKKVNDTYGHLVGDQILIEVTHVVQENIRESDILGRWGGEEFIIILSNTDKSAALVVAQNIKDAIELYSFSRVDKLTISAGVTDILSSSSIQNILHQADSLLYEAKESGRNCVKGRV